MVQGTVVQEVPTTKKRKTYHQVIGDKTWESTKEVLGQCSLGTDLGRCSLGAVLGQFSLGTVLGQCGLGTVLGQSSLGTVLGRYSLGTVVLGQWSWDSGPGTV